jgi:plasmid stabilization system protein ParE
MRVSWSEPALEDLAGIQAHIAKDSPYYARQFIERIFDAAEMLEDFPELGRKVPEADYQEHIREILFQNYRIIYLCQADQVYVLAVIHGSRDLQGMEHKPWAVG